MTQALGIGLLYERVENVLDFLGLILYIVGVIGMAAGATWLTVRISPTRDPKPAKPPAS